MEGGCYCGAVRYRMEGPPIYVNGCHCRDCQKLTGSAFAINAMIERDRIVLLRGDDDLRTMDGATTCGRCATLLWATVPQMFGENILFLRAGTLDESERIVPDAHFFVRSKHPWVTIPAGVPVHETIPGAEEAGSVLGAEAAARVGAAMR